MIRKEFLIEVVNFFEKMDNEAKTDDEKYLVFELTRCLNDSVEPE